MSEAGDFDDFYRRELTALVAFVCKAGFGLDQARDAAQEAMFKLYLQCGAVAHPRAYVRKVAYREAMAEATRTRTGVKRAVAGGWTFSTHHDPDVAVLGEERDLLLSALNALPQRQRLVMAWLLDGFSRSEISEQLGISEATVRSNVRHARKALAKRFPDVEKEARDS